MLFQRFRALRPGEPERRARPVCSLGQNLFKNRSKLSVAPSLGQNPLESRSRLSVAPSLGQNLLESRCKLSVACSLNTPRASWGIKIPQQNHSFSVINSAIVCPIMLPAVLGANFPGSPSA